MYISLTVRLTKSSQRLL